MLRERILVLDGAMGTAIQRDRPDEAGYRGERFAEWACDVQGNNDLLTLTQPEIIASIHREYLGAGADIIETNTFNANGISLRDYEMTELAYELNYESARLARRESDIGVPRRAVRRVGVRRAGQQRPPHPHPARDHRVHPPRVPRGRRRHHRDQHVQRQRHLPARLRDDRARVRVELRVRPPGAA